MLAVETGLAPSFAARGDPATASLPEKISVCHQPRGQCIPL